MQPYSHDWRVRVMAALERGERRRDVAECFAVSVPTITRWVRRRETGGLAPKPVPGPPAVQLDALRAALPARLTDRADATLAEQCAWWRKQSGVQVSTATMSRALTRLGWTPQKKSLQACERQEAARMAWRQEVATIRAADLVFVDETGSHLGSTPTYA